MSIVGCTGAGDGDGGVSGSMGKQWRLLPVSGSGLVDLVVEWQPLMMMISRDGGVVHGWWCVL